MLLSPSFVGRRLRRLSLSRILLLAAFLFLLDALVIIHQLPPASRTTLSVDSSSRRVNDRRVFIASIHRDSAPRLHASWSNAVIDLVKHLGPKNVYFSAVEAYSGDGTKTELVQLQKRLESIGVENTVILGPAVFELEDEVKNQPARGEIRPGWIRLPDTKKYAMRRVPLQVAVRNQALEPLHELARGGQVFDTVVWIDDDIVFDKDSVSALLETRDGDYAAACAVDFGSYPYLHDSQVLRDIYGQPPASSQWPWFFSGLSRSAAQAGYDIPVYSCWNGLVAFDASPFYAKPPLKFRAAHDRLAELRAEASERCLIHADNTFDLSKGIWVNPTVRVGHDAESYEKARGSFPGWLDAVRGSWANRIGRWFRSGQVTSMERLVQSRIRQWAAEAPKNDRERYEPGMPCLMDDLQVIQPRSVFKFKWQ